MVWWVVGLASTRPLDPARARTMAESGRLAHTPPTYIPEVEDGDLRPVRVQLPVHFFLLSFGATCAPASFLVESVCVGQGAAAIVLAACVRACAA